MELGSPTDIQNTIIQYNQQSNYIFNVLVFHEFAAINSIYARTIYTYRKFATVMKDDSLKDIS